MPIITQDWRGRWYERDDDHWHAWFAWRPVLVEQDFPNRHGLPAIRVRWLRTVERRYWCDTGTDPDSGWEYREAGSEGPPAYA